MEVLDIGVADEAARLGDELDRQACDVCDTSIEGARALALGGRTCQRREILREREVLGLGDPLLAELALPLELGGGERGQLQRGAERKPGAAEDQPAFHERRHHRDSGYADALVAPERLRHLGGPEAAVTLAKKIF